MKNLTWTIRISSTRIWRRDEEIHHQRLIRLTDPAASRDLRQFPPRARTANVAENVALPQPGGAFSCAGGDVQSGELHFRGRITSEAASRAHEFQCHSIQRET